MLRFLLLIFFFITSTVIVLSNDSPVHVWFWRWGVQMTLGEILLTSGVSALLYGIIIGWLGEFRQRRRARRAEGDLRFTDQTNLNLDREVAKTRAENVRLRKEIAGLERELEQRPLPFHPGFSQSYRAVQEKDPGSSLIPKIESRIKKFFSDRNSE